MGNIYFRQKKYAKAIKMYRMGLDQISKAYKMMRYIQHYISWSPLQQNKGDAEYCNRVRELKAIQQCHNCL